MAIVRVKPICSVVLFILIISNAIHLNLGQTPEDDEDQNVDSTAEQFMYEHHLDNHDVEDYEINEQGYNADEDYQEPEVRHSNQEYSGDYKDGGERKHVHRDDVNVDDLKAETLELIGNMSPEMLKQLNVRVPEPKEVDTGDSHIIHFQEKIEKLEKVDKTYRQSISSLLATTALLRVQIMQLNEKIKRLDERDQEKDAKITTLENVIKDKKYSEDGQCGSVKDTEINEKVNHAEEL